MQEEWRDIAGYEGIYQVSNFGSVKSFCKNKERILTPRKTRIYLQVTLYGNQIKQPLVHRLVAEAFIPNPENKPEVDHIDCNATNNAASNLRWVSHTENNNNPITRQRRSAAKPEKPEGTAGIR